MLALFERLCAIESPSRSERAVADAVASELRDMGLDVEEDSSAAETGSDAGNLLARVPGPEGARTVLLCAHLDTVPLDAPVAVECRDGFYENRNEAILGADNKAAVATILAAARVLLREGPPVGLELLFTTCEEVALAGAKAFDVERLGAEFGFVFDHATPVGDLIVAAPSYYGVTADFHGRPAHAGIRPEDGRNAIAAAASALARIESGRLDPETTANVGLIEGGTAANVVAERCRVVLEARSLDSSRASAVTTQMIDRLTQGAADADCDLELTVEELFRSYRLSRTSAPVVAASEALSDLGIEPEYRSTGGGSDANVFIAAGLPVLNVANGTERNHEPDERVSIEALETVLDLTIGIVARSA